MVTYFKGLKAALLGGLVSAGLNLIWYFILYFSVGLTNLPKGFALAIVFSSILPLIIGALVYVTLVKNFLKGETMFLILAAGFTLLSLFPSFQANLPDGSLAPKYFALLTVPMHLFTAIVGSFFIIQKSK